MSLSQAIDYSLSNFNNPQSTMFYLMNDMRQLHLISFSTLSYPSLYYIYLYYLFVLYCKELLGKELSFKREVDSLKDRLALSEREVVRVTTAARMHKNDKVRLSFLKTTFTLVVAAAAAAAAASAASAAATTAAVRRCLLAVFSPLIVITFMKIPLIIFCSYCPACDDA